MTGCSQPLRLHRTIAWHHVAEYPMGSVQSRDLGVHPRGRVQSGHRQACPIGPVQSGGGGGGGAAACRSGDHPGAGAVVCAQGSVTSPLPLVCHLHRCPWALLSRGTLAPLPSASEPPMRSVPSVPLCKACAADHLSAKSTHWTMSQPSRKARAIQTQDEPNHKMNCPLFSLANNCNPRGRWR